MNFKSLFNIVGLVLLTSCAVLDRQETTKEYLSDSSITLKVKSALADTPNLKSHQISVKTMKGAVQLSGFVQSDEQASLAGDVASSVKGVKEVSNDLIVKRSGTRRKSAKAIVKESASDVVSIVKESASDSAITGKVKLALLNAADLKSTGIKVTTNNGSVILTGTVPTQDEASRAENIASGVEGVISVQNQIQVVQ